MRVVGAIDGLGLLVQLCDVSLGGFAIFSAEPFLAGVVHSFTFTIGLGVAFPIVAKAMHCTDLLTEGDHFVSGWEFLSAGQEAAIRLFLDAVT